MRSLAFFVSVIVSSFGLLARAELSSFDANLCEQYRTVMVCSNAYSNMLSSKMSVLQLKCQATLDADPICADLKKSTPQKDRDEKFNKCSVKEVCDQSSLVEMIGEGCADAAIEFGKEHWEQMKKAWQMAGDSVACNSSLRRKKEMFETYNRTMPPVLQRPLLPDTALEPMNCSEVARVLTGFADAMTNQLESKIRAFEMKNPKLKGNYANYPAQLGEYREWQLVTAELEAAKFRKTIQGIKELPEKVQALFQQLGINLSCYNGKQRAKMACYGAIVVGGLILNPGAAVARSSLKYFNLLVKTTGKVGKIKSATGIEERLQKLYAEAEAREIKREQAAEAARFRDYPTPVVQDHKFQKIQDLYRSGNTAEAIAYEKKVVQTLSSAKMDYAGEVGEGIGQAKYVKFEDGTYGIWKPDRIVAENFNTSGAASEIAAYKVDQALDLHRVPVTVSRSFDGQKGSVQLMVGDLKPMATTYEPNELRVFDYLIDNRDRHNANYLRTNDGRMVGIDHGLANKRLMNPRDIPAQLDFAVTQFSAVAKDLGKYETLGKSTLGEAKAEALSNLSSMVGEKSTYLKLKSTTSTQWTALLKDQMNAGQLREFLERRDKMVEAIERARAKFGDDIFRVGPVSPLVK